MNLEVSYNFLTNEHDFSLNGATKHYGEFGTSAEGNITRLDNVIDKMPEKIVWLEEKLVATKGQFENAKEDLAKPFEKADELKTKVLRLVELNQLLHMGEVEEKVNPNLLIEDLKNMLGLERDDGNIYNPLAKDLDNDGVSDRYDYDFKDSDYFETTYDVDDNVQLKENKAEKPLILKQIKSYQENEKESEVKECSTKEYDER